MNNRQRSLMTANQAYGGARRDRTADPLLAKQMLSQLSYGPLKTLLQSRAKVVGLGGFEPPTSPLSGVRSNQLSYRPGVLTAGTARRAEHQTYGRFVTSAKLFDQITCAGTHAEDC
jgi:hypothetical protein